MLYGTLKRRLKLFHFCQDARREDPDQPRRARQQRAEVQAPHGVLHAGRGPARGLAAPRPRRARWTEDQRHQPQTRGTIGLFLFLSRISRS